MTHTFPRMDLPPSMHQLPDAFGFDSIYGTPFAFREVIMEVLSNAQKLGITGPLDDGSNRRRLSQGDRCRGQPQPRDEGWKQDLGQ